MKTCLTFCTAALLSVGPLVAQNLVSAGTITSFSKESGRLALVPESRTGNPLLFSNMSRVPVFYASGGLASIDELHPGQNAMIHYLQVGKQVVISKVTVPDPPRYTLPVIPIRPTWLPAAERHALDEKAFNGRDITRQPGSKAHIDHDITTN